MATKKPRANVEPFVRSTQPSQQFYPSKDRLTTTPPPAHSNGLLKASPILANPPNQKPQLKDSFVHVTTPIRTSRLENQVTKPNITGMKSLEPMTELIATSPKRSSQPFPATSTPISGFDKIGRGTEATPTRLFPSINNSSSSNLPCQNCTDVKQKVKFLTEANRELKRLLVASLGDDLKMQMEQIINEKAAISCDLDLSLQQLAENLEIVDKVSIDCDVWQSKYLASRLMIDQLASLRKETSKYLLDSQQALGFMLREREVLSEVLHECTARLERITPSSNQQVPHPMSPMSLSNGTVTDQALSISKMIKRLSESSVGGSHVINTTAPYPATTEHTPGEKLAKKVLASQEREVQLPLRITEGELLSRHSGVRKPHLLLSGSIDFQCQGCKGRIIHL